MIIDPLIIKIICVIFGPLWALLIMKFGYKMFDKLTPFDTAKELATDDNTAIGIVVGSIFIALGIVTGLIIGMALF